MSQFGVSHSRNEDFQGFLFDYIGEDRNGGMVTVLSALARQGIDPWQEASELARLPESEALIRLDAMMAKVRDVPLMIENHAAIAQRLLTRLPRHRGARASSESNAPAEHGTQDAGSRGWSIRIPGFLVVAIVLGVLALAQVLSFGVAIP